MVSSFWKTDGLIERGILEDIDMYRTIIAKIYGGLSSSDITTALNFLNAGQATLSEEAVKYSFLAVRTQLLKTEEERHKYLIFKRMEFAHSFPSEGGRGGFGGIQGSTTPVMHEDKEALMRAKKPVAEQKLQLSKMEYRDQDGGKEFRASRAWAEEHQPNGETGNWEIEE